MKILRDFVCWKCKVKMEDVREYEDYPMCPECDKPMKFLFTACNFDSHFQGSHNCEYGTHGRKFNGCTKEGLLRNVSKTKRIAEGRVKKGHEGQVIVEEKK